MTDFDAIPQGYHDILDWVNSIPRGGFTLENFTSLDARIAGVDAGDFTMVDDVVRQLRQAGLERMPYRLRKYVTL